jgi:hypothetical protein
MKNSWYKILIIIVLGLFTFNSCADLEVENLNEPDKARAIVTSDDLIGLAGGLFSNFFTALQEYSGPALAMGNMADANTCSWGNAAMKDLSSEPRVDVSKWNNEITYPYFYVNTDIWGAAYSAISSANDVAAAITIDELEIGEGGKDNDMVLAWVRFMQGVAHGYVGLIFDQGNIIDETTDLGVLELFPYKDVAMAGIAKLDEAITLCANTFSLPETFIRGNSMTNVELEKLARTMKAKFMISWPRNGTEAAEIVWGDVLNVVTQGTGGLDFDVAPECGSSGLYDYWKVYQTYPGWGRTDHRIINLMDEDYPSRWPDESDWASIGLAGDPGEAASADARLASDFEYLPAQAFRPDRGHYHFSHYAFSRYDFLYASAWYGIGPTPWILSWEVDMIEAEARLATGDKAGAIAILNDAAGPRKVRGGLADVDAGATTAEVLEAVRYEIEVECHNSNTGYSFFLMRRNDNLQYGTLQHFPLPKNEQELSGVPTYTIDMAPDGIGRALGSWVGKDGIQVPADLGGSK